MESLEEWRGAVARGGFSLGPRVAESEVALTNSIVDDSGRRLVCSRLAGSSRYLVTQLWSIVDDSRDSISKSIFLNKLSK